MDAKTTIETFCSYIDAQVANDLEAASSAIADDIVYCESYGPEYRCIDQFRAWFAQGREMGSTIDAWDIKSIDAAGDKLFAEWHFECTMFGEKTSIDGMSVAEFGEDGKIHAWREYQAVPEHTHPFESGEPE